MKALAGNAGKTALDLLFDFLKSFGLSLVGGSFFGLAFGVLSALVCLLTSR